MNFQYSDEHIAVQQSARDFAITELLPQVLERDEAQKFPEELRKKMGEMGFLGMMTSPEYGGMGMDYISYVLALEEIAKVILVNNNHSMPLKRWMSTVSYLILYPSKETMNYFDEFMERKGYYYTAEEILSAYNNFKKNHVTAAPKISLN